MTPLSRLRLETCDQFARSLAEFKESLSTAAELMGPEMKPEAAVAALHASFLQLLASFETRQIPPLERRDLDRDPSKADGLTRIMINGIELVVWEGRVVDVGEEVGELAEIFVNQKVQEAEAMANMLWDYKERVCDVCGVYFTVPGFETPVIRRRIDERHALALHVSCDVSHSCDAGRETRAGRDLSLL